MRCFRKPQSDRQTRQREGGGGHHIWESAKFTVLFKQRRHRDLHLTVAHGSSASHSNTPIKRPTNINSHSVTQASLNSSPSDQLIFHCFTKDLKETRRLDLHRHTDIFEEISSASAIQTPTDSPSKSSWLKGRVKEEGETNSYPGGDGMKMFLWQNSPIQRVRFYFYPKLVL